MSLVLFTRHHTPKKHGGPPSYTQSLKTIPGLNQNPEYNLYQHRQIGFRPDSAKTIETKIPKSDLNQNPQIGFRQKSRIGFRQRSQIGFKPKTQNII